MVEGKLTYSENGEDPGEERNVGNMDPSRLLRRGMWATWTPQDKHNLLLRGGQNMMLEKE
jgi:hypothetical protein